VARALGEKGGHSPELVLKILKDLNKKMDKGDPFLVKISQ